MSQAFALSAFAASQRIGALCSMTAPARSVATNCWIKMQELCQSRGARGGGGSRQPPRCKRLPPLRQFLAAGGSRSLSAEAPISLAEALRGGLAGDWHGSCIGTKQQRNDFGGRDAAKDSRKSRP